MSPSSWEQQGPPGSKPAVVAIECRRSLVCGERKYREGGVARKKRAMRDENSNLQIEQPPSHGQRNHGPAAAPNTVVTADDIETPACITVGLIKRRKGDPARSGAAQPTRHAPAESELPISRPGPVMRARHQDGGCPHSHRIANTRHQV